MTCRKPFGARARRVTLLLMDVDGVLTDGRLGLGDHGHEVRRWHVRDGSGIVLARRAGLQVGFLSGRGDAGVRRRARELGVDEVHLRARDKGAVYEDIRGRLGLEDRAVCYIGDDLVDLPVLRRVGVPVAVADAHAEVRRRVPFVTAARGGDGAVREVIDAVLQAQGRMPEILAWFEGER
ncbi:MAG TPA: HAD family hydrolase [Candidatus Polarisedimenticolia bacterium]|nr:HAD family hydrolase [Candidatus Polarisedimenticolia bacterium]